jgi:signal transduction histidine kinase
MTPLRLHIDIDDQAAVGILSEIGRGLGWEIAFGSPTGMSPDLLATGPENLQQFREIVTPVTPQPQILLYADPADLDPVQLFGIRVFAVITPGAGPQEVEKILQEAALDYERWRRESSVRHEMRERVAEGSVIMSLALELLPDMGIDEVLDRIVDRIYEDLGYGIVSIMLLDEDEKYLRINAARGLAENIITSSKMEVGRGVSGSVAHTGEPLLIGDVENDPRFGRVRSHGRYSSKSLICVPLKVGNRVIGVLNANNKRKSEPLDEHDLQVLTVFAAHVSNNIEKTRLYDHLEKQTSELKEAYKRLRDGDSVKSDFIVNVSHEYRTPVTIILGYLELLKGSLTDQTQLEKVTIIMEAANRLSRLIDDSTELLRLDTGAVQFHFRIVPIHYFLEELVRDFWPRFGSKGVDLSLDIPEDLPPVHMDPDKMVKAFEKLLENALKFTLPGGFTRIEARLSVDGGIQILVEDSGPGIDMGDRNRIFERFEQGGDIMTEKPEGIGLGLPIARSVIVHHGGTITLDETLKTGCRFVVSLPAVGNIEDRG